MRNTRRVGPGEGLHNGNWRNWLQRGKLYERRVERAAVKTFNPSLGDYLFCAAEDLVHSISRLVSDCSSSSDSFSDSLKKSE